MEGSFRSSGLRIGFILTQPTPRRSNPGIQLIEQFRVVMVNRVDQAGDQNFGVQIRFGKKFTDHIRRPSPLDIPGGNDCRINERPVLFLPLEQTFPEESIQRRHHRGVSQAGAQARRDLLDARGAQFPNHRHDFSLSPAKPTELRHGGADLCRGIRADRAALL